MRFPGALRVAAADDDTAAEVEDEVVGDAEVEDMVVQVVRSFRRYKEVNLEKEGLVRPENGKARWR